MELVSRICTNNPCYKKGMKIAAKGTMLHSVGCAQPNAEVFINTWNNENYGDACPHAIIDGNTGTVYQTLPWNHRGWHCYHGPKGSGNDTHIGIEMAEPACIKYESGSRFTCSNPDQARAVVKRTYESAVELFAMLCQTYGLDPLADGVIISHKEGCARGIASNHGDPEHLWTQLGTGYTMDGFRRDVAAKMNKNMDRFKTGRSYVTTQACYLRSSAGTGNNKVIYNGLSDAVKAKCRKKDGHAVFKKGKHFQLKKVQFIGNDVWGQTKSGYWVPLEYNGKVRVN